MLVNKTQKNKHQLKQNETEFQLIQIQDRTELELN